MKLKRLLGLVGIVGALQLTAGDVGMITQKTKMFYLAGNNSGFGILAKYAKSPSEIIVERTTSKPAGERLEPFCLIKVFAPNGDEVVSKVISGQKKTTEKYTLNIPAGKAGIWRFSVSGGRQNDDFTIKFPATGNWGIRGEMGMTVSKTMPQKMYLYLPETVKKVIMLTWGSKKEQPKMIYSGKTLGVTRKSRRYLTVEQNPPVGKVVTVDLTNCAGDAIAFDGVPGLLCPTEKAALILKGGTVEASGLITAGPLQARARKVMTAMKPADLKVQLNFPANIPADLKTPRLEALFYGKYGVLSSIDSTLAGQVLDPASPFYGANCDPATRKVRWDSFLNGGVLSPFDASGIASAVALPGKMNPGYNNQQLLNRGILSAFYHIASMQGDDILREGTLERNNYPMTHAFFSYNGALALPLFLLKDKLTPEQRKVWIEAVKAVGDKMVNFRAYESNQWSHVISGLFYAYLATGEKRFLKYAETYLNAFADGAFGPDSKYGQHPTGFYLEEYGPDGNYDHLSAFTMVNLYYKYKDLKDADPTLVKKLHDMIAKNLYFKSFYWVKQPNGDFVCPSSFNCRTLSLLAFPSYPGDYIAKAEFPLSLTRFRLTTRPGKSAYPASVFPHLANTDEWAMALIKEMVPRKGGAFKMRNFMGGWTSEVYDAYKLPECKSQGALPVDQPGKVWELPGQVAWNLNGIYGIVFWDVIGANKNKRLTGIFGGGPTFLYNKKSGAILCAMKNKTYNRVKGIDDLTFSCVYGFDNAGKLYYSGTRRSQMKWLKKDQVFQVESEIMKTGASVSWRYDLKSGRGMKISVAVPPGKLKESWVNLPLFFDKDTTIKPSPSGGYILSSNGASVNIGFDKSIKSVLSEKLPTPNYTIKALRIKLPPDGKVDISISL